VIGSMKYVLRRRSKAGVWVEFLSYRNVRSVRKRDRFGTASTITNVLFFRFEVLVVANESDTDGDPSFYALAYSCRWKFVDLMSGL